MFGRTRVPPPTVDDLRAHPTTVDGWSSGRLQAAVAWPPPTGRRPSHPVLLLGHDAGWDVVDLQELGELDARRIGVAESVRGYRTCFEADVDVAATDSEVGDLTRGLAPGSIVVVGQVGNEPDLRLHATMARATLTDLAGWTSTATERTPR